jgi:hypothetical protein
MNLCGKCSLEASRPVRRRSSRLRLAFPYWSEPAGMREPGSWGRIPAPSN